MNSQSLSANKGASDGREQPAVLGTAVVDLLLEKPGFLRLDLEGWPVTAADRLLTPKSDAAMVALRPDAGRTLQLVGVWESG